MSKNRLSLSVISLSLLTLATSLTFFPSVVQASKPVLDKQACVEGLVKEGLQSSQASVWCNYKEECIQESVKEGLPLESAKTVCDCTIAEFRNKYTTEKFKTLTQQVNTDKKVARQLREVGEMCFEKILFE